MAARRWDTEPVACRCVCAVMEHRRQIATAALCFLPWPALDSVCIQGIPISREFWLKMENGGDLEQANVGGRAVGADRGAASRPRGVAWAERNRHPVVCRRGAVAGADGGALARSSTRVRQVDRGARPFPTLGDGGGLGMSTTRKASSGRFFRSQAERHKVENFFHHPNRLRRVSRHCDKTVSSFMAFAFLVSALDWLR